MALIDYVIDENEAGCSLFGMVCDYLIVMQLQLGVAYTCNTYAMCFAYYLLLKVNLRLS